MEVEIMKEVVEVAAHNNNGLTTLAILKYTVLRNCHNTSLIHVIIFSQPACFPAVLTHFRPCQPEPWTAAFLNLRLVKSAFYLFACLAS